MFLSGVVCGTCVYVVDKSRLKKGINVLLNVYFTVRE